MRRLPWLTRARVLSLIAVCALTLPACQSAGTEPAPQASGAPEAAGAGSDCDWQLHDKGAPDAIEGWADTTSLLPGEPLRLHVSTPAESYEVRAYRMGWDDGKIGCRIATATDQQATYGTHEAARAPTYTVSTSWPVTTTMDTSAWSPGTYLLRLVAAGGGERYVPITVRRRSADGTVVIVNAVTTWQAYNKWGGYNLYHGPDAHAERARAVSFDRPYSDDGAGEFLRRELPLISLAERLKLPLDYVTDIDVHRDRHLLDGAKAVVSLGHDEYWSPEMRDSVTRARDAGVNLAFLGANAVFRRIRLAPTPVGPDRLEINYKVAREDPLHTTDDKRHVTANWPAAPAAEPESSLIGAMYDCFPAQADAVVVEPTNWLFAGTGVQQGQHLRGIVAPESDRVNLAFPTPRPIEVVMHSAVSHCKGHDTFADSSYYVAGSDAGVFASGTIDWICSLGRNCRTHSGDEHSNAIVQRITENLLRAFAAGPAGRKHPAVDNLARLGIGRSGGPY